MLSRKRKAMYIAFIAGILLLISGINGVATIEAIQNFVTTFFPGNLILEIVFIILIFIASLGGIAVILGGIIIGKNKIKAGKIFIALGMGMGLIGLLISIIIAINQNNLTIGGFFSLGTIGLILSITARMTAK